MLPVLHMSPRQHNIYVLTIFLFYLLYVLNNLEQQEWYIGLQQVSTYVLYTWGWSLITCSLLEK